MNSILVLALLFATQGAPAVQMAQTVQTDASDSGAALQVEPWVGTPEEAVRELRRLSLDGDHADALQLAGRALLTSREPGGAWSEARRAELDYGVGLSLLMAGDELGLDVRADAQAAFDSAAALAGPGRLRLDALYNAALVQLLFAEQRRAEIPEVQAAAAAGPGGIAGGPVQPAQPGPAGAMPPGLGDEEQAPTALDQARAAYLDARAGFVRRLRADWEHADTAANLELIERRLEQLDEIEQQREEQEQEQQAGEDEAPSDDDGEEQDEQDQEQQPDDAPEDEGEQGEQEEPQEPPPPGDDPSEAEPEPDESEPPPPEDGEPGEPEPPTEQPEPTQAPDEEQHLTREEVVRLLDQLEELEQQARELERVIQRQRRIPVERDW